MGQTIVVRGHLAERVKEEARRLGLSVDEYVVELLSQGLDPKDRAVEYVEAAEELLQEAREEREKGNIRQAAEKVWGAAALAVKAYAYWKEGRRITSHSELWEYKRVLAKELGKWVSNAWAQANTMHTCFYEGWCAIEDVEDAFEPVERLVKEIALRVKGMK